MYNRNANIDLLRIISMFMVLLLHALSASGALNYLDGINYFAYWGLEALCIVAVDCFVIISGFYLVNSTFKIRNIIRIVGGGLELYIVILCIRLHYIWKNSRENGYY